MSIFSRCAIAACCSLAVVHHGRAAAAEEAFCTQLNRLVSTPDFHSYGKAKRLRDWGNGIFLGNARVALKGFSNCQIVEKRDTDGTLFSEGYQCNAPPSLSIPHGGPSRDYIIDGEAVAGMEEYIPIISLFRSCLPDWKIELSDGVNSAAGKKVMSNYRALQKGETFIDFAVQGMEYDTLYFAIYHRFKRKPWETN